MAAGGAFTVGLTTSGRVYAWGSGSLGQLGDGATAGSTVPTTVPVPSRRPAGPPWSPRWPPGSAHALALTSTGQVYAWGADLFGQLGDGATTPADDARRSSRCPPGSAFTAVAAGGDHSLALTSTGQVYAWGANGYGQLGDGTTVDSSTPSRWPCPAGVAFTGGGRRHRAQPGRGHRRLGLRLGVRRFGSARRRATRRTPRLPTPVAVPSGVSIASGCRRRVPQPGPDHDGHGPGLGLRRLRSAGLRRWSTPSRSTATFPSNRSACLPPPPSCQIAAGQTTSYALTSGGVAVGVGWRLLRPGRRRLPRRQRRRPGRPDHPAAGNAGHRAVRRARRVGRLPGDPGPARRSPSRRYPTPTYGDPPVDVAPTVDSGLGLSNSGARVRAPARWCACSWSARGTCTLTPSQAGSFAVLPGHGHDLVHRGPGDPHRSFPTRPDRHRGLGAARPHLPPHRLRRQRPDIGRDRLSRRAPPRHGPARSEGTYADHAAAAGTLPAANYGFVVGPPPSLTLLGLVDGVRGGRYRRFGLADGTEPTAHGTVNAFFGSMAGTPLAAPVVGAAYTPLHDGYWMVASDGGIFAFGVGPVRRVDGWSAAQPAHRRHGRHPGRQGLLGGRLRRRDLRLRRRRLLRIHRRGVTGRAHRGHGRHRRRPGLLAGGRRRRRLRLRRRRLLRLDRWADRRSTRSWAWPPPPTAVATGWSPGAAPCSPSATPPSRAASATSTSAAPIVGMTPTADGQGYWLVGADGGVFAFGDAPFFGSRAATPGPDRRDHLTCHDSTGPTTRPDGRPRNDADRRTPTDDRTGTDADPASTGTPEALDRPGPRRRAPASADLTVGPAVVAAGR